MEANLDYKDSYESGRDFVVTGLSHFDIGEIFECGQAFRFNKQNGGYNGIAFGKRLEAVQNGNDLILKNTTEQEFETLWKGFFGLDQNYRFMRDFLYKHGNKTLRAAVEFSPGIRILRQDPWEVIISFILSQNCNIPRIKNMIESLSSKFGQKLTCGGFYFPEAGVLADLKADDLASVKCGYRAEYIIDAAKKVYNKSLILDEDLTTEEIYESLLEIKGVGPKVADCILLFGFNRIDRVPMDVWVKKIMAEVYPKGFPKKILPYAGLAQQYLFHFYRVGKDI